MAEKSKNPLAMDPIFPDRPRLLPKPGERKSGPLGLGVMEQLPRPLKDMPRPIQERRGRRGER